MLLPPTENFTLLFLVAQLVRICLECRRPQFDSWVRKIHWRRDRLPAPVFLGFLGGSDGKESAYNVGDLGSIPGLERSPREGKGYPLQYSGLENSMDCGRLLKPSSSLSAHTLPTLGSTNSADSVNSGTHGLLQGILPTQGTIVHGVAKSQT